MQQDSQQKAQLAQYQVGARAGGGSTAAWRCVGCGPPGGALGVRARGLLRPRAPPLRAAGLEAPAGLCAPSPPILTTSLHSGRPQDELARKRLEVEHDKRRQEAAELVRMQVGAAGRYRWRAWTAAAAC